MHLRQDDRGITDKPQQQKNGPDKPVGVPLHPSHPSDGVFSGVARHEDGMSAAEPLAIFPGTEYIKR